MPGAQGAETEVTLQATPVGQGESAKSEPAHVTQSVPSGARIMPVGAAEPW